jgi:hypothetical protein
MEIIELTLKEIEAISSQLSDPNKGEDDKYKFLKKLAKEGKTIKIIVE